VLHMPTRFAVVLLLFAPIFVQARTWRHAQVLLLGALLTPGQRTVCSILRMVGLRRERHFVNYTPFMREPENPNRIKRR